MRRSRGIRLFFCLAASVWGFGAAGSVCAGTVELKGGTGPLFDRAAKAFEERRFDEAAQSYRGILDAGVESAATWFNLGNSYYRAGQRGRAIHAWEEALRMDPGDEDAAYNLRWVREQLGLKDQSAAGWKAIWRGHLAGGLAAGRWVGLVLLWIWGAGVARAAWKEGCRTRRFWKRVSAWVIGIGIYGAMECAIRALPGPVYGIVVSPDAGFRHGPSYESAMAFRLLEGQKISLADRHRDWWYAKLSAEQSGWAEPGSVLVIGQMNGDHRE